MKSLFASLLLVSPTFGQAPGVPIVEQSKAGNQAEQRRILKQVEKFGPEEKLMTITSIQKALLKPSPRPLTLPVPGKKALSPAEVAKKMRPSLYRVGWGYLCNHCDNWHINLAGGYAVTNDGVIATCAHVIDVDNEKMREGGLIAVDQKGKVFPVTAILANHDDMDAALVKIDTKTVPLPLNDQVGPGDEAFCLSRPLDQKDYFSKGMVNRFYWNSIDRDGGDDSLNALGHLKMNVSSRWAPGSSGSPVVDKCGNVIGHVATISRMKGNSRGKTREVFITLHTATPARAVKALASKGAP